MMEFAQVTFNWEITAGHVFVGLSFAFTVLMAVLNAKAKFEMSQKANELENQKTREVFLTMGISVAEQGRDIAEIKAEMKEFRQAMNQFAIGQAKNESIGNHVAALEARLLLVEAASKS